MPAIESRLSSTAVDDRVTARSPVIVAFAVSRVVSIVTIVAAYCLRTRHFTLKGLALFDGGWYHFIAEFWYGPQPNGVGRQTTWPFFPLLPGFGHVAVWLHLNSRVVMVLVSNAALLVALFGVRRLVVAHPLHHALHEAAHQAQGHEGRQRAHESQWVHGRCA